MWVLGANVMSSERVLLSARLSPDFKISLSLSLSKGKTFIIFMFNRKLSSVHLIPRFGGEVFGLYLFQLGN